MGITGWSEQEEPKEDRNPKKLGWEGKKVVSRTPGCSARLRSRALWVAVHGPST